MTPVHTTTAMGHSAMLGGVVHSGRTLVFTRLVFLEIVRAEDGAILGVAQELGVSGLGGSLAAMEADLAKGVFAVWDKVRLRPEAELSVAAREFKRLLSERPIDRDDEPGGTE